MMTANQMPTAVLADWYADRGDQIREAWLRAEGRLPPAVTSFAGSGSGDGYGYGSGSGDGYGSGSGDGDGYGYQPHEEVFMPAIGDYVVVRTREQGCMCGEYQWHTGREVCLAKARQIYSWSGKRLTLVDFASVPGECRLSVEASGEVLLLEACGIIPTTSEVAAFLRAAEAAKV